MTEADWRTTSDVEAMLGALPPRRRQHGFQSERYRTFAVACARRVWSHLGDQLRAALDEIVREPGAPLDRALADARQICEAEQERIRGLLAVAYVALRRGMTDYRAVAEARLPRAATAAVAAAAGTRLFPAARDASLAAANVVGLEEALAEFPDELPVPRDVVAFEHGPISMAERAAQADLLRCIFGNPFRPVAFDPAWRTEAVVGLARGMDDAHDFAALPVLADALEDAGCADAGLLAHARGPGPHARGCHVIDHVLGRW